MESKFVLFCANGHLDKIKNMIENEDIDIHYNNDAGLCSACRGGHLDVVKYLISLNITIFENNNMAFIKACDGGHSNIIKYIESIDYDNKLNDQTYNLGFIHACLYDKIEIADYLIDKIKKSIYYDNVYELLLEKKYYGLIEKIVKINNNNKYYKKNENILNGACGSKNMELVAILIDIDLGLSINKIFDIVYNSYNLEAIKYLNKKYSDFVEKYDCSKTIAYASIFDKYELVKYLEKLKK
jgi:ankyrin repeat protein